MALFALAAMAWGLAPLATGASSKAPTTATQASKDKKASAPAAKPAEPVKLFAPDHAVLLLQGLKCQVHRGGEIRQEIEAGSGQYDEEAKVLDMSALSVNFKDQGTTLGLVTAGGARVYMMDVPEQKVGMHDMLLNREVRLRSNENWVLQTPAMRYIAKDSLLTSRMGYVKQFPLGERFLVGRGTGFEIKLLLEQKTFEYCREFGKPAEYRKSDEPVLKP